MPLTLARSTLPPGDFLTCHLDKPDVGTFVAGGLPSDWHLRQPIELPTYTFALLSPSSSSLAGVLTPCQHNFFTIIVSSSSNHRAAVSLLPIKNNDLSYFHRQLEWLTEGRTELDISVLVLYGKDDKVWEETHERASQEVETALKFAAYPHRANLKVTFKPSLPHNPRGVIRVMRPTGQDRALPVEILAPSPGEKYDFASLVRTHAHKIQPSTQLFGTIAMLDYHILTVGYGTANATGAGQLFEIFDGEKFCRLPPLRPKVMDVLKCEWDRQGPFGAGPRKGGDLRFLLKAHEQAASYRAGTLEEQWNRRQEAIQSTVRRLMAAGKYCAVCGREDKLKKCSKCAFQRYCGPACAAEDWPNHKEWCKANPSKEKEK